MTQKLFNLPSKEVTSTEQFGEMEKKMNLAT